MNSIRLKYRHCGWRGVIILILCLAHYATVSSAFGNLFLRSPLSRGRRNIEKGSVKPVLRKISRLDAHSSVSFQSPLLDDGYPPAVKMFKSNRLRKKPLLLYLPGFDGSLVAPFLQFPELGTEFDVKGMATKMDDRSSVEELKNLVINFIDGEVQPSNSEDVNDEYTQDNQEASSTPLSFMPKFEFGDTSNQRPVFLIGESFGGILALETSLAIKALNAKRPPNQRVNLQLITLINPATCYNESELAKLGPPLTKVSPLLYPIQLLTLLPLFTDSYAFPQLLLSLQSKALPSVIDTPQREAYMGRIAFSLPQKLEFMPQQTLKWRLEEWLTKGCKSLSNREKEIADLDVPVLIVAGECDNTLPSVAEADRLSKIFKKSFVHIVDGAGHACTSGSRVDLTALIRGACPNLFKKEVGRRTQMKEAARNRKGIYFGTEDRYDGASIGLMPTLYWTKENFDRI